MKLKVKNIIYSSSKEISFIIFDSSGFNNFKEGQFIMISKELSGKDIKRAYSIATGNYDHITRNELGIIVKKVNEYGMSKYLVDDINIGDEVEITGPYGHMFDINNNIKKYLFVSIGSGLGPLFSIYKNLIYNNNFDKISNIFGERYYGNTLEIVNNDFNINNKYIQNQLFLSREENYFGQYKKGYVQDGIIDGINFLADTNIKVFLCGKPVMVDEVIKILVSNGISKDNIKYEKY